MLKADLVLLAMGFVPPVQRALLAQLGVTLDARGNVTADTASYQTSLAKVFACGDMRRGQSLVVWAIREGRQLRARSTCSSKERARCRVKIFAVRSARPQAACAARAAIISSRPSAISSQTRPRAASFFAVSA